MTDYTRSQIITYLGNKRKLLGPIEQVIDVVKTILQQDTFTSADAFSGSGIVSRLLKKTSTTLYTNDMAGYSETLNRCYLSTPNTTKMAQIKKYIEAANLFVDEGRIEVPSWIRTHWAPCGEIRKEHRVYFTEENALRIDRYRHFINLIPRAYRPYLLAPLLVECSIHNNTNGQFSGFYKKDGIGCFGGKTGTDVKRITQAIRLSCPLFSSHPCRAIIDRKDANEWIRSLPPVDFMYYDPPYNKHPYSIYYFLLDIINNWDTSIAIPDTYRGQPKTWKRSPYNSYTLAKKTMEDLIANTKASFILLSYNNGGIIPLAELDEMLRRYGSVTKIPVQHRTYNKLKGIANYKRTAEWKDVKEFLWLIDTREHMNH